MSDFEAKVQQVYETVLRAGMGAIDVGAHVGRHSMEMLRLIVPGGRVLMFEPLPDMFKDLSERIQLDAVAQQHAVVYPFALSDTEGSTEFCVAVDAPGYSGIKERHYDVHTDVQRIQVEMRRLDNVAQGMSGVDFIKIDTEGAEWNVLKGATETIRRFRPVITFEFGENSYSAYGVNPADVYRFFRDHHYIVLDILARQLDEAAFCKSSVRQEVWDYIALPVEKLQLAALFGG